ncbi:MAG: hypothetical protein O7B79_02505 [SAR324 cluster bacterium]|nr:hypothetical protein [SAR324 cluster bacterium]
MKRVSLSILLALGLLVLVPQVQAQPGDGFGLFVGSASHTSKVALPGLPFQFESSGASIGIDWQFAVSDNFSIVPFLMSSSETVTGDVEGSAAHGILAISFRLWVGGFFLGPHMGSYSEVVTIDKLFGVPVGGSDVSSSGTGAGFMIGFEAENGFLIMLQTDSATVEDSDGVETDLTGSRLHIGYRWK